MSPKQGPNSEESAPAQERSSSYGGAILAISPRGTINKANLPARRILGQGEPLESKPLGVLLAQTIATLGRTRDKLVLSLSDADGLRHDITLVLSDQQDPAFDVMAGPAGITEAGHEERPGTVADYIAHELRNNVAIILGLAQLLETSFDSIDARDRASGLKGIQAEAEHALLTLDGLLKLVESRRVASPPTANVPLHSVLHRVIADHKRRHPDRSFVLTGDAPVFATGNSTWMRLAIANLIANAEKVTPRERTIQINVRQEADRALIIVLDEGAGLGPAVYKELWDIYTKGPPEGIEITGSGIGLSLCKELVEAMGGRVWAGPRISGGSAFAVSLHSMPEVSASDMTND